MQPQVRGGKATLKTTATKKPIKAKKKSKMQAIGSKYLQALNLALSKAASIAKILSPMTGP